MKICWEPKKLKILPPPPQSPPPLHRDRGLFSEFLKSDFRFGFRRSKNYIVPNLMEICWKTKILAISPLPPPQMGGGGAKFKNRALSVFLNIWTLAVCKKSAKSVQPILRFLPDERTDKGEFIGHPVSRGSKKNKNKKNNQTFCYRGLGCVRAKNKHYF